MDDHSVTVKEKGVMKTIFFSDISLIKVYGFKFYSQRIGLSWVKDVVFTLNSGEEVGLFNCKSDGADFLIETIKINNPNVIIQIEPESIGGTFVNGFRLARDPLSIVQKKVVSSWLFNLIVFVFCISIILKVFLAFFNY